MEKFEARMDAGSPSENGAVWRENSLAMGVGLNVNRGHDEQPLRTYVKAIVRDGLEHVFINVNDRNILTLVVQQDGSVTEHHDIPR